MINYVKCDLLDFPCDVMIQGCNCYCTMGAGVAAAIAKEYPEAAQADKEYTGLGRWVAKSTKLGNYSTALVKHRKTRDNLLIINAYTQNGFKKSGRRSDLFEYGEFKLICRKLKSSISPKAKIAMPKIGAGLAGGDWTKIEAIINEVFDDREIVVCVL